MCGIVCYYGGAGNNLTRVLTGMSAIIYRAPDSTGVGIFGDDTDPIRLRKAIGSVDQLIETLQSEPIYTCGDAVLASVPAPPSESGAGADAQARLLSFEGLPLDQLNAIQSGSDTWVNFDELVELGGDTPRRLSPGWPGNPHSAVQFSVRTRKEMVERVQRMIHDYDLSPIVIQNIFRRALHTTIKQRHRKKRSGVSTADILQAFDELFETILVDEKVPRPQRLAGQQVPKGPYAQPYLWRYLIDSTIRIPADYDRDGVRCVFRLLDAALLCRIPFCPDITEHLQQILDTLWPVSRRPGPVQWRSLYGLEKALNVYGWAAATAVTYLQREEFVAAYLETLANSELISAEAIVPGQTDPVTLRYFTQPVISHGRWAMQSAVTLKNAHPFTDLSRQRAIVLNGQFDGQVEERLRQFLTEVAGYRFRSENSSEYFALLWGYYYERLKAEQTHSLDVRRQVDTGLSPHGIGSQTIDMGMYRRIGDKSASELDAMALIQAARQMVAAGGQLAAAAVSQVSPRTVYVVSHNRPVFIVQRLENDDFMVVSDINAAMGLFPQVLIHAKQLEMKRLSADYQTQRKALKQNGAGRQERKALQASFNQQKNALLDTFKVAVYPLDGKWILARIKAVLDSGGLARKVQISDFDGRPLPEIEPFITNLNPEPVRRDFQRSFHETHLEEIPDRLNDIIRYYHDEQSGLPEFNIHTKLLRRRFGKDLSGLKRLVVIGTGSAYHMGRIAENYLRGLLGDVDYVLIRPGEINAWARFIFPQNDLVILLSWSSTTADMVETARLLQGLDALMVAITGKKYADMALLAYKSGGVIPVLSGEEVTVSAIKSTVCMLFCLDLFGLWLSAAVNRDDRMLSAYQDLRTLPVTLSQVLHDDAIHRLSKALAQRHAQCRAVIVIDADKSCGTGREIALKLEENSWTGIGKTYDYRDLPEIEVKDRWSDTLILVNACCLERLDEAVSVMARLYLQGIGFIAVTVANRLQNKIETYSQQSCIVLPRLPENLQPFAALVFYYRFAFDFGRAHGRQIGAPPRNRAKSLTASRSIVQKARPTAEQVMFLSNWNAALAPVRDPVGPIGSQSLWEQRTLSDDARRYFKTMRRLAGLLDSGGDLGQWLEFESETFDALQRALFSDVFDVQEVVFMALDRSAEAAARAMADHLECFFNYPVQIRSYGTRALRPAPGALRLILSTGQASAADLQSLLPRGGGPAAWLGPRPTRAARQLLQDSAMAFFTPKATSPCSSEWLYCSMMKLFIRLWHTTEPAKADVVDRHFKRAARIIPEILNHPELLDDIEAALACSATYTTAFYIGPSRGGGTGWVDTFDRFSPVLTEFHPFGHSSHGPLVTVDPRVRRKFVRLISRRRMIKRYGQKVVEQWEKIYLNGQSVDGFLQNPVPEGNTAWQKPFFARDHWYLPVLRSEYKTFNDNLIIVDAASERYLDQAIDELATYGCRHPQMIAIVQEPLLHKLEEAAVFRFPFAGVIRIPEVKGGSQPLFVTEFILPLVVNLIAMAMATASRHR